MFRTGYYNQADVPCDYTTVSTDPMENTEIISAVESDSAQRHRRILDEMHALYAAKNSDYGDAYHREYLEEGAAVARVMLSFKLNRYKNLTAKGAKQKVKGEAIRDTLIDLANYAILTIMEMEIEKENEKK